MTSASAPKAARHGAGAASRRDEVIDAAVSLFHERGYHAVTMDDVGAELGISGPALYRYFRGKQELLMAVLGRLGEEILREEWRATAASSPLKQIEHIVEVVLRVAIENRELVAIHVREGHNLLADASHLQEVQEEIRRQWVRVLGKVRSDLTPAERRAMIEGVVWLSRSVAFYEPEIDDERLLAILKDQAMSGLRASGRSGRDTRNETGTRGPR